MGITHVHSSIIHKTQEVETTQVSVDGEWINKIWHIHTMDSYSAIKRCEELIHTTAWMNLENVMLSERKPDTQSIHTVPFT